ncbi:MAG TPA: hypothetical protein VIV58_32245 [Kofleriaceae bacterium]
MELAGVERLPEKAIRFARFELGARHQDEVRPALQRPLDLVRRRPLLAQDDVEVLVREPMQRAARIDLDGNVMTGRQGAADRARDEDISVDDENS